ncbi:MAG TPA: site-specific integrase, partial [Rubricoccaceae bacterium]
MSSLYTRGGNWYVQYTEKARAAAGESEKRRFSLGTDDERTARTIQSRADFLYETGAWDPWDEDLDHAIKSKERQARRDELTILGRLKSPGEQGAWQIVEAVRDFLQRPELRDSTRRSYASVLEQMVSEGLDPETGQLDKQRIGTWLRKGSEGRQASYMVPIRAFDKWARAHGYIPDDAAFVPPSSAKNSARLEFYTPQEHAKIMAYLNGLGDPLGRWLGPIVETTVYTGLRLSEVGAARVEWYDDAQQTLSIPSDSGKSKRNDTLYVPTVAQPTFRRLAEQSRRGFLFEYKGRPLTPHHTGREFKAAREAAGVTKGTFHTLRHTCASWLAQGGAPAYAIQKQMRHASIETTM